MIFYLSKESQETVGYFGSLYIYGDRECSHSRSLSKDPNANFMNRKSIVSIISTIVFFFLIPFCFAQKCDNVEYTLTSEDYDFIDNLCSCTSFENFANEDDVKEHVPSVLAEVFPNLGKGSEAAVTYDFFNGSAPDLEGTQQSFTVSPQEYTDLGFGFGNFSNLAIDVPTYADFKVGAGMDGNYIDVTHEFFSDGSTSTVTTRVVWVVSLDAWVWAEPLPDASYVDFFGEDGTDFSSEQEGMESIPAWLSATKMLAEDGDHSLIQWNWEEAFTTFTLQSVALFIFDGTNWDEYTEVAQVTPRSFSFAYDGEDWIADNTIAYTLSSDDYASIAAATSSSNPSGSNSMTSFGNYDLSLWTSEEIYETITNRLLQLFPAQDIFQKYQVTYEVWRPGNDTDVLHTIWDGSAYVDEIQPEKVAHFIFSDEAIDQSCLENDGVENGNVDYLVDRFGDSNKAASFDGDGDYIDIGNSTAFDFTDRMTITTWIKANFLDNDATIVGKGEGSWSLKRVGSTDRVVFSLTGVEPNVESSTGINDDRWHHLAATYDGSMVSIYVDGVLNSQEAASGSIALNSADVWIGANSENSGNDYRGLIDDMIIYNRVLSADEVLDHYTERGWDITNINTFSFAEQSSPSVIDTAANTVHIEVGHDANITSLVPTFILSVGATAQIGGATQISSVTANDFTNPVTYIVTAQDGLTNEEWVVTVEQTPLGIDNFKNVLIYPNPASDRVSVSGIEGDFSLQLLSLSGQVITHEINETFIDVTGLEKGVYFLRLQIEGKSTKALKLIKR